MSSIVFIASPPTHAPLLHRRLSGGASSAMPASSRPLSRILAVAVEIAALVPPDGAVLKPCPSPKRSVSAGTTLTSSAGTPSSPATSRAYSASLPSGSVVRLSTILPVGCTRGTPAGWAWSAPLFLLVVALGCEPLPLLMGGQRVVVLQVAERRLWTAQRVGRHGRPLAAGIDAGLRGGHGHQPGVVRPRLGPCPLGIATELPRTGVAPAHGPGSARAPRRPPAAARAPPH